MNRKFSDFKSQTNFPKEDSTTLDSDEKIEEEKFSVDLSRLIFSKGKSNVLSLKDVSEFFSKIDLQQAVKIPKKHLNNQQKELKDLEDDIYIHFMNKRVRGSSKKKNIQKVKVIRTELVTQISQAGYLHYSWGQVMRQRKKDLLICGRLSCENLVDNLDSFLDEMQEIAESRSFFRKKVSCPIDKIRKLQGYILMDQYMQKLSTLPTEK